MQVMNLILDIISGSTAAKFTWFSGLHWLGYALHIFEYLSAVAYSTSFSSYEVEEATWRPRNDGALWIEKVCSEVE